MKALVEILVHVWNVSTFSESEDILKSVEIFVFEGGSKNIFGKWEQFLKIKTYLQYLKRIFLEIEIFFWKFGPFEKV